MAGNERSAQAQLDQIALWQETANGKLDNQRRYLLTRCRQWLERVLLSLEGAGVLEATRERYPAHYHVALFPRQYKGYVTQLQARQASADPAPASTFSDGEYEVRNGDSLWTIAKAHGTTVDRLRNLNGIRGSRIYAGQVIDVPGSR